MDDPAILGGVPVRKDKPPLPLSCQEITTDDAAAVEAVLRGGELDSRWQAQVLELAFAEYAGWKYAVAVSSGTAALYVAYAAAGVGPASCVVTSPLTFCATANAAAALGAEVIFADVRPWGGPGAGTIGEIELRAVDRIENPYQCVVPVHYAGHRARLDEAVYPGSVPTIEDCCHAPRLHVDSGLPKGLAACYSFDKDKLIVAGEGGVVCTDDEEFASRCRCIRDNGRDSDGYQVLLGLNFRMDEMSAALAASQLRRADGYRARLQEIDALYRARIEARGVGDVFPPPFASPPREPHLYPVLVARGTPCGKVSPLSARDFVRAALLEEGISCRVHYRLVYDHPWWRAERGTPCGKVSPCPVAEDISKRVLSLPFFPSMVLPDDVDDVVEALDRVAPLIRRS